MIIFFWTGKRYAGFYEERFKMNDIAADFVPNQFFSIRTFTMKAKNFPQSYIYDIRASNLA